MTPHDTCRCGGRKQVVSRLCNTCAINERTDPVRRYAAFVERFWSRVQKSDGCWTWNGTRDHHGYGKLSSARGVFPTQYAHRISYLLTLGEIRDGLELDHLCRNPACVNPDHLEPVSHRENLLRGRGISATAARVTHCPAGHPYDEANTYRNAVGHRSCRACHRKRVADAAARKKAARA